jgi:hypothetical protein
MAWGSLALAISSFQPTSWVLWAGWWGRSRAPAEPLTATIMMVLVLVLVLVLVSVLAMMEENRICLQLNN